MAKEKGFNIDGFKKTYKAMGILEEDIVKTALNATKKLAEVILGESQKIVPVDFGALKESGTVRANNKTNIVTISYNTPYARKQHEDNTLNHPKGGQAKYLEQPFNEKAKELESYIKKALERKFGK